MSYKSYGFLSWSLFPERDPFGDFGKLAALLFDEVVLQAARDDLIDSVVDHLVRTGEVDHDVAAQLQQFVVPVQRYKPAYQFLHTKSLVAQYS